jgi:hypothetical protein
MVKAAVKFFEDVLNRPRKAWRLSIQSQGPKLLAKNLGTPAEHFSY